MDASSSSYITFGAVTTEAERVAVMSPLLNAMLSGFDSGNAKQGVEASNNETMERLGVAGLLQKGKICHVETVGVHPDNREKSMLVPIDVQDRLARMATDGWNWSRWNAFACTIPTGALGDYWKAKRWSWRRAVKAHLPPLQS